MLIISTVAVYIHYKWHKFCLVNSQLAGAYTHSNHFGDSGGVHSSVQFLPRNILKILFIFVLNWPDALRHFLQRPAPAGERTPDSPPSELCNYTTPLLLMSVVLSLF